MTHLELVNHSLSWVLLNFFSSWGFEGDVLGSEIRRLFSSRRQRAGFLTCEKQPSVPLYLPTVLMQSVLISYGCRDLLVA